MLHRCHGKLALRVVEEEVERGEAAAEAAASNAGMSCVTKSRTPVGREVTQSCHLNAQRRLRCFTDHTAREAGFCTSGDDVWDGCVVSRWASSIAKEGAPEEEERKTGGDDTMTASFGTFIASKGKPVVVFSVFFTSLCIAIASVFGTCPPMWSTTLLSFNAAVHARGSRTTPSSILLLSGSFMGVERSGDSAFPFFVVVRFSTSERRKGVTDGTPSLSGRVVSLVVDSWPAHAFTEGGGAPLLRRLLSIERVWRRVELVSFSLCASNDREECDALLVEVFLVGVRLSLGPTDGSVEEREASKDKEDPLSRVGCLSVGSSL